MGVAGEYGCRRSATSLKFSAYALRREQSLCQFLHSTDVLLSQWVRTRSHTQHKILGVLHTVHTQFLTGTRSAETPCSGICEVGLRRHHASYCRHPAAPTNPVDVCVNGHDSPMKAAVGHQRHLSHGRRLLPTCQCTRGGRSHETKRCGQRTLPTVRCR